MVVKEDATVVEMAAAKQDGGDGSGGSGDGGRGDG